jgi:hypothetical protein
MKLSDIASRMLEIIPAHRYWIKHQLTGGAMGERKCLYGALRCVPVTFDRSVDFENHFLDLVREMFPGLDCEGGRGLAGFNDHPGVRYDDVRTVLEKIRAGDL